MAVTPETVAQILALPMGDRAFLARNLLESLDSGVDSDAEARWAEEIDSRSREMSDGSVSCEPIEDVLNAIRTDLDAGRHPS